MLKYKEEDVIREETYKIIDKLLQNHGISIKEKMTRDYMMKYQVSKGDEYLGVLIWDYSPKKKRFSIRTEADSLDKEILRIVEDCFENRDNEEETEKKKTDKLEYYYNVLKAYRDMEFDFSPFAEELKNFFCGEDLKKIGESKFDFTELEKYYTKVVKDRDSFRGCKGHEYRG